MDRINWTERKTNGEVLYIVKEKISLIGMIKWCRSKIVERTIIHSAELLPYYITPEDIIDGKRTIGWPRNYFVGQLNKDVSYKDLKEMANDRSKWRIRLIVIQLQ